jgi:predicted Zn-dependent protease
VRYDLSDRLLIQEFQQAFAFWARVLDAEFYGDQSTSCAIAIVEGTPGLLSGLVVARSHLPDRANFQGWIAVDPKASTYLSFGEAVGIWGHEIGHLLGLKHSTSALSLMYFIDFDSTSRLDLADLRALSRLHTLRRGARVANALWVKRASNDRANLSSR